MTGDKTRSATSPSANPRFGRRLGSLWQSCSSAHRNTEARAGRHLPVVDVRLARSERPDQPVGVTATHDLPAHVSIFVAARPVHVQPYPVSRGGLRVVRPAEAAPETACGVAILRAIRDGHALYQCDGLKHVQSSVMGLRLATSKCYCLPTTFVKRDR